MKIAIPVLLAVLPLAAQEIKMPVSLDKLAAKASEVVDVSLDGALLQLASRFLSDRDPDESRVKHLVTGLKGVYVKSFEFEDRDQYKDSDVEELRTQLKAPGWSRIISAHSKRNGDNSDIYLKTDAGQISGLAIIVAEPRELTVISIIGPIHPEDIRDLGGHWGIPRIDVNPSKFEKKDKDKKEDNQ